MFTLFPPIIQYLYVLIPHHRRRRRRRRRHHHYHHHQLYSPWWVLASFKFHNNLFLTLGSTQPLTEISTRNISWGVNAAGAYG
jgi:hypothetical protein